MALIDLKFGTSTRQLNHFKPRVMLGRDDQSCELWVEDASVSRRHAEIWMEGEVVYIRDLGSANGTWVNGQPLGPHAVAIEPNQTIHLGHAAVGVVWPGKGGARTHTTPPSPEMVAMMAYRAQQQNAAPPQQPAYAYAPPGYPPQQPGYAPAGYAPPPQQYAPPPQQYAPPPQQYAPPPQQYAPPPQQYAPPPQQYAPPPQQYAPPPQQYAPPPQQYAPPPQQQYAQPQPAAPIENSPAAFQAAAATVATGVAATVGVGGTTAPTPSDMSYRRQGGNNNGTLLIALPGDTFANEATLDGFLEYTATDNETVASIIIELVEVHQKGHKKGHVWDRCLVRQGPWQTKKNDVLPMPFRLRVPSGTSASGPICYWELRAYVDIKWASDIEASSPITMRNTDIEKIRDALGTLDYRIKDIEAAPLGQKYTGKFNPPMHLAKKLNITDINLEIEYLGTNLKVVMEVEKNKMFHFDKKQEFVFALDKLRQATVADLAQHWQIEINKLMA